MNKGERRMSNNKIVKYKEGFIFKLKNFLKSLFRKNNKEYNDSYVKQLFNEIKEKKQDSLVNEIKVDAKEVYSEIEKKNYFEEIAKNEEALNMLSIDRLKELVKYGDSIIEQYNEKIKKLKNL